MDYTALKSQIAKMIKELGVKVTIQRDDADLGKTYGVFNTTMNLDADSPSSTNITTQKTMYITATNKLAVVVGDYVVVGSASYYITAVDEYKPADVIIAYKVALS